MLFPSTLFISSNPVSVDGYLKDLGHLSLQNNPDIFVITDYSVENIRTIKKFLSQKPYSHSNKIVYIPNADLLNPESQNTLLKNLEEPGENNYFILTTAKPHALLSTVISRCHQIRLISPSSSSLNPPLSFSGSLSQKLTASESLTSDKTTILPYLEEQLLIYQQALVSSPNQETSLIITKIIKAIQMINANVDPKAAIDFLLLS
jgi:DNA polymerase III delta prime subunit